VLEETKRLAEDDATRRNAQNGVGTSPTRSPAIATGTRAGKVLLHNRENLRDVLLEGVDDRVGTGIKGVGRLCAKGAGWGQKWEKGQGVRAMHVIIIIKGRSIKIIMKVCLYS